MSDRPLIDRLRELRAAHAASEALHQRCVEARSAVYRISRVPLDPLTATAEDCDNNHNPAHVRLGSTESDVAPWVSPELRRAESELFALEQELYRAGRRYAEAHYAYRHGWPKPRFGLDPLDLSRPESDFLEP